MTRDEAKKKDRSASREDCRKVIEEYGSANAEQVSEILKSKGLKITPNAANCRMLESCRKGDLWREELTGKYVYHITPPGKKDACIAYYKREQEQQQINIWKRETEKVLPLLPTDLQKHLKQLKNEVNKVA